MSFDAAFAATALPALYARFGVDATVQRGGDPTVPVRVIVDYDQAVYGEYGHVVGRVTSVRFQVQQWSPQQGDLVAWTDHLGSHAKPIESSAAGDDGLEHVAVLHG